MTGVDFYNNVLNLTTKIDECKKGALGERGLYVVIPSIQETYIYITHFNKRVFDFSRYLNLRLAGLQLVGQKLIFLYNYRQFHKKFTNVKKIDKNKKL